MTDYILQLAVGTKKSETTAGQLYIVCMFDPLAAGARVVSFYQQIHTRLTGVYQTIAKNLTGINDSLSQSQQLVEASHNKHGLKWINHITNSDLIRKRIVSLKQPQCGLSKGTVTTRSLCCQCLGVRMELGLYISSSQCGYQPMNSFFVYHMHNTQTHVHACTQTHTSTHTFTHTYSHTHAHASIHTHTHKHTHKAHTHTHTHTHTHKAHTCMRI